MSLFRNSASLLLANTVALPLLLAAGAIAARTLGDESFGFYGVALAFAEVGAIATQLGWPLAVIYRLRRLGSAPSVVFTNAVVAVIAMSLVVLTCAWLAGPRIAAEILEGAPSVVMALAFALIPMHILRGVFSGVARGIDRFDLQNWHRIGLNVGQLSALAVTLLVFDGGLREALIAVLAVHAAAAACLGFAVWRCTGAQPRASWSELQGTARFGSKVWIQGLVGTLHERIDVFMIVALLNAEEVAYYSVAVVVVGLLKMIPEAIAMAVLPQLAGLKGERVSATAASTTRHALFWTTLSILAAGLLGPLAIPLVYGPTFGASLSPFFVLLPAVIFLTIYRVMARYFVATDQQWVNNATQIVSTALNIGLNLWWIPRYGIAGAAWASFASYAFECIGLLVPFLRSTKIRLRDVLVITGDDLEPYRQQLATQLARLKK